MLLTGITQSHSASQQWGWGQSPALLITAWLCWATAAFHHTFERTTRTDLQLSEPRFSSNWDPPASHLMVNAYSVARPCSVCAQILPVSNAIGRLSLIGSNLTFPAFPPLPHTATVTGCTVRMLRWLRTRRERLSHLAHCFLEAAGSSRASAQHVTAIPRPLLNTEAVPQPILCGIPASLAVSGKEQGGLE